MTVPAPADLAGVSLGTLLGASVEVPPGLDCTVTSLSTDSRKVRPGALFFALAGTRVDGARFIDEAVQRGAVASVSAGRPAGVERVPGALRVRVPEVATCLAEAAARFHRLDLAALRLIGVTGTNGKTSVSHFIAGALDGLRAPGGGGARAPCGLLGTLGYGRFGALRAGLHTTPDLLRLYEVLADLYHEGVREAVLEVSSHALDQGRVTGCRFDTAVFTNLSRDHLDYHGDMQRYCEAKSRLFRAPGLRVAVVNAEDPWSAELLAHAGSAARVVGFALGAPDPRLRLDALVQGRVRQTPGGGMHLSVRSPWGEGVLATSLIGRFNALNLLAALAVLGAGGDLTFGEALERLSRASAPPGRMQALGGGAHTPLVVIDYAHTPDALERALEAARSRCAGELWCVFGCGGERDRGKRAQMGAAAVRLADRIVVTDDNPRAEDGDRIVRDILEGIEDAMHVAVERDRARAVALAVDEAAPGDLVLVAGKGHEDYQEVAGVRRALSDLDLAQRALERRRGAPR